MRLLERLTKCFDAVDKDQAKEYLSNVRDAWRDISAGLTRNAWIIVLLIAVFELAAYTPISSITLGPFALGNVKYVRLFIPVAVSYLFYEQVLLTARWIETEAVHRYLMHILSPQIEKYDFDALLAPRLPALSNLVHSYANISATRSKRLRAAAQYGLGLLLLFAVLFFEAFALKELSGEFGIGSVLFWINVAVTAALVVLALAVFLLWLSEERLVF